MKGKQDTTEVKRILLGLRVVLYLFLKHKILCVLLNH
jgi:hypothetical protein